MTPLTRFESHRTRAAINAGDVASQIEGTTAIRKLLSRERDPPVDAVLEAGVLPRLVALLQVNDPKLQFEASWAITNIASTEQTAEVVNAGAVPFIVAGTLHTDANVRDQCVWCLGNIAGDRVEFRDALLRIPETLYGLMLNIKHAANLQLLRNATWVLSNLCRGKPSPDAASVASITPALAYLLQHTDKQVLADALWGLSYLTDGDERLVQAVADAGVAPRCVALMSNADAEVVMPAVRIIGNLICGTDQQTQVALEAGALRALHPLLSHAKRNIRRETCWALSNVAASTQAHITALMTVPGLMPQVVQQLRTAEWYIRREAAWVVSNVACNGTADHVRQLVSLGVIPPLVDMLRHQDTRMLFVVLDTMANILAVGARLQAAGGTAAIGCNYAELFEEANALPLLEDLQRHPNEEVYNKCLAIVTKYYPEDDEPASAENAPGTQAPAVVGGVFAFGMPSGPAPFGCAPNFSFMTPPNAAAAAAAAAASAAAPACAYTQQQQQQQLPALNLLQQQPFGGMQQNAYAGAPAPAAALPPAAGGFSAGFNFSAVSFV
jgi:hypothetical protein